MIEMLRNGELHLISVAFFVQVFVCLVINYFVAHKYRYSKVLAVITAMLPLINTYATCVYIALVIFHSRHPRVTNSES